MEERSSVIQQALNRAEKLGQLAREAAEESIEASREAIGRAEQISKSAKEAAEVAEQESVEAVKKAEQISELAKAAIKESGRASQEAIDKAEQISRLVSESIEVSKRTFEVAVRKTDEALESTKMSMEALLGSFEQAVTKAEQIANLAKGEKSPGIEKGMKIENHFVKALKDSGRILEIHQSTMSRGWDVVITEDNKKMAFDVVSVSMPRNYKVPKMDLRGKKIKSLLKTAEKINAAPFWAYQWDGKWWMLPMLESHTVRTTLTCRDAIELTKKVE